MRLITWIFLLCLYVSVVNAEDVVNITDLIGTWAGEASYNNQTTPLILEFERQENDTISTLITIPALHLAHYPLGGEPFRAEGNMIYFSLFTFTFDRASGTLQSILPVDLVPLYQIPFTIRRVEKADFPLPTVLDAPYKQPVWVFNGSAPFKGGAVYADRVVYAGDEQGLFYALNALKGDLMWSFQTNGAIRTRPAIADGALFLYADDGYVYKLATETGQELWRVKADTVKIERLPPGDPKTKFDRFGADPLVFGNRVFIGTHDGRILALNTDDGKQVWQFPTGDAILAAPALANGTLYFGSYDGFVYALEAETGRLLWKFDTRKPVVSTPAIAGDCIVIGSRSYDLFGLSARTGQPLWTHYIWFSWIESSATIYDGIAYVGSSDALVLLAVSACDGRQIWQTDVPGWAWGQPTVTTDRVFMGFTGSARPGSSQKGGVVAVDRQTGKPVWQYVSDAPQSGQYGFAASSAVGLGRVYLTGLDGKVYAFEQ